jgi:O-antigen/teichoic acid export membrane protein
MRSPKTDFISTNFSETVPVQAQSLSRQILSFVRTPMYRNGYALVLSSLTTSALGVVFWVLAAHLYPTEVVGFNSALISAMMFLSAVSQLNLNNGLIRFVRNAGRSAGRFALLSYVISIAMSGTVCLVFLAGLKYWAPAMAVISTSPLLIAWFVAATASWCIFALEDGVLTGIRFATWVPVENSVYSLEKIALLVIFAFFIPQLGVFAAWTLGVVALILPTNFLIFRSLLPGQPGIGTAPSEKSSFRSTQVAKFVAADYLGGVSWMACTYLMPVIVTNRIGSTSNAYFYLAWTIANTLYLITPNIGSSMIAETSTDPDKVWAHLHRVFLQVASLVIPLALAITLGAPIILKVFGNRYSIEGTFLLRLLALSAIPNMVTALFISVARAQQRRVAMLVTMVFLSAAILALSYLLMPGLGILGVGIAWLVGQSLVAAVILLTQFSSLRSRGDLMKNVTGLPLPRFPTWLGFAFQKAARIKFIAPSQRIKRTLRSHYQGADMVNLLPEILQSIPCQEGYPNPETWTKLHQIPTVTDMQVYFLGSPGMIPVAVLKLARTEKGLKSAIRENEVLEELHSDPRLGGFAKLIPKLLIKGEIENQMYVVEQIIPGITAFDFFHRRMRCAHIQAEAIAWITEFHKQTTCFKDVGPSQLIHWIDEPILTVKKSLASISALENHRLALDRLSSRLYAAFSGRHLPVSWIHGDFFPGNILVTPDGKHVTGFVDWESAQKENLPFLDLCMLLVTTRMIVQKKEMGPVINAMLLDKQWAPNESGFWEWSHQLWDCDLPDRQAVVLLCWLHHIANNIMKSTRYHNHRLWVFNNIETVLQEL